MPDNPVCERLLVMDRDHMLKLWLDEQVRHGKMTMREAEAEFEHDKDRGKVWGGPLKDSLGNVRTIYRLAADMRSWYGGRVTFVKGKYGDLVVIKGWPAGRNILTGTRYRTDHPKMIELQIGKPGLRAAARESARFGIYFAVGIDVLDYAIRDKATLGQLLGNLTVDIPSVAIAAAIGGIAGSLAAGTAFIGAIACGPLLVAFVVSAFVGYSLYKLDQYGDFSGRLGAAYDRGLVQLRKTWTDLGSEAEQRWRQLQNSEVVNDLQRDANSLGRRLGKVGDEIRGELVNIW